MSILKNKSGSVSIGVKWINKPDAVNVYIGRGSPLGNPFIIGEHGDRNEVCDKYEIYLRQTTDPVILQEIKRMKVLIQSGYNVNLQCFCPNKRCHGESIKRRILE